jgi:protein-S-isoprenylcysteine O-methyltransferase Ste14
VGLVGLITKRVRQEEAAMLAKFGCCYRAYMQTTGSFWPKF